MTQSTPVILIGIAIALALGGLIAFLAIRLAPRRSGSILVVGLFLVAIILGIAAIASLTLIAKA
jgi:hypothetical protein